MNPVDEKRRLEIVERANKASEPPWYHSNIDDADCMNAHLVHIGPEEPDELDRYSSFDQERIVAITLLQQPSYAAVADERWRENADFIAASREDVPDLADALRLAWDENKRLRTALERFCWVDPDASLEERAEDAKAARAALGMPERWDEADPPESDEED